MGANGWISSYLDGETDVETDDGETDDECRRQIAVGRTVGSMLTAKTILTSTLGALTVGSILCLLANTCSVAGENSAGDKRHIRRDTAVGGPTTRTRTIILAVHHIAQT